MAIGTKFIKEEPYPGFGRAEFGGSPQESKEFRRSFGDKVTPSANAESNRGTTHTDYTDD